MQPSFTKQSITKQSTVILELTVRNHPGVMSHICGLFARRAFNVEGILCLPLPEGDQSRIWLQVGDDQRLEQMVSQVDKLEDVVQIIRHADDPGIFNRLTSFVQ
jgi:acetolactate synthase-1/3 small subunit